jgi:hypothetical protein
MVRIDLLKQLQFGSQVAEDEVQELANYFVETHQWDQIARGKIDIIRGEKGSGKSAIYSLLSTKTDEFFDRGVLLVAAEHPRGATVFKDLIADPPTSEEEFKNLWKIYILTLAAQKLREYDVRGADSRKLYAALEEAKLLERELDLAGLLRAAQHFVRVIMRAEIQAGIELDQATMVPSAYTGKISFREPSHDLREKGFNSVDSLFKSANSALKAHGYKIWIMLDRLDVAFAENHALEANALRALLRVYNDLKSLDEISLKIFVREDIWKRAFQTGFREASHINDYVLLDWSASSLLNLIVRRILNNKALLGEIGVDPEAVLSDSNSQLALFEMLFPEQVEQRRQQSPTFKWMLSRCADATEKTAPRELIHLLKSLQIKEIERLEKGGAPAPREQLFDRSVFKPALIPVSLARLNQYLYAEYPDEKPFIALLQREKTEQSPESLSKIWKIDENTAAQKAEQLRELGFFQRRGSREQPTYWVPFLYRDALGMIQGREKEEGE